MRLNTFIAAAIIGFASASPVAVENPMEPVQDPELHRRQVGTTSNEFTQGGCRPIIFAFARGSTEVGNMGSSVGPPTGDGLKSQFGANNVAVQGIDYPASLETNFLPGGADPIGINGMKDILTKASSQCPDAILVAGGYSQGAAVCHRAIENLPANVKNQIAAVVTYGDTQNQQDKGQIPNFDRSKLKIICNEGDAVCNGTLTILPAHLDYVRRVPEALSFYGEKIKAAQAAKTGA